MTQRDIPSEFDDPALDPYHQVDGAPGPDERPWRSIVLGYFRNLLISLLPKK